MRELSYGEQRALEILLAVCQHPRLLLLDEPTAGLSPAETLVAAALVSQLPREMAIVIIEHDMDVAFSLCETVTVLHAGKVLANGAADRETAPEDLPRAIQRMVQTSFLGVVDCFDQSIIAGQSRLRIVFPALDCAYQPANVSRGLGGTMASRRAQFREACGRTVYAELLRQNALDYRLVRAARAEVRRRFAESKHASH